MKTTLRIVSLGLLMAIFTGCIFMNDCPSCTEELPRHAWGLLKIVNTRTGETIEAPAGVSFSMIFTDRRTVRFYGLCNLHAARYSTSGQRIRFRLGPSTVMACDEKLERFEAAFAKALSATRRYRIAHTDQLTLTGGGYELSFATVMH